MLLDEVRSSIDYYRNQPGSSPLLRIVATGGAAQLPGLTERLSALVGVPVEHARPRELVALGDIGFAEEELPRLDPYLPAAVGLALGGAGVGTVIDLLPRTRRNAVEAPAPADPAGGDRGRCRVRGAARRRHVRRAPERLARQVAARDGHRADRARAARARSARSRSSIARTRSPRCRSNLRDAARDRRRVADDDQPHHGEPPAGHLAHVVPGSGRRRPRRSRRAPPTPDSGRRERRADRARTRRRPRPPRRRRHRRRRSPGRSRSRARRRTTRRWRAGSTRWAKVPQIVNIYVTSAPEGRRSADNGAGSGLTFTATAVLDAGRAEQSVEPVREGGEMKTKNIAVGVLAAVLADSRCGGRCC